MHHFKLGPYLSFGCPIRQFGEVVLGTLLSLLPLACGVQQALILSLMFFKIYMKPVEDDTWKFGIHCHPYAQDYTLFLFSNTKSVEAVEVTNLYQTIS